MRAKEIAITGNMYTDRKVISLLQKIEVAGANGRVRFWPEVQLTLFLRMRTKDIAKT